MAAFKPYTFLFHDDKGHVIREEHNWSHGQQLLPSDAVSMARGLGIQYQAAKVVVFEGREVTSNPFLVHEPEIRPETTPKPMPKVEMSEEEKKAWDNWPW